MEESNSVFYCKIHKHESWWIINRGAPSLARSLCQAQCRIRTSLPPSLSLIQYSEILLIRNVNLKGLSHEIDFNYVDKNWQILALTLFYTPRG